MRHALSKEHLEFYFKNHFITFDEVISEKERANLEAALEQLLGKETDPQKIFEMGYDTWRKDPRIKKVVLSPLLAEIASALCKERTLRIGCDQVIPKGCALQPTPIKDLCSVQKVLSGLILNPATGSATFYAHFHPIPFDELEDPLQLMIIYAEHHALYTMTPTDPHKHALKKEGYGFGDHIAPRTHPLVLTV